jgi:hypothetical protein
MQNMAWYVSLGNANGCDAKRLQSGKAKGGERKQPQQPPRHTPAMTQQYL